MSLSWPSSAVVCCSWKNKQSLWAGNASINRHSFRLSPELVDNSQSIHVCAACELDTNRKKIKKTNQDARFNRLVIMSRNVFLRMRSPLNSMYWKAYPANHLLPNIWIHSDLRTCRGFLLLPYSGLTHFLLRAGRVLRIFRGIWFMKRKDYFRR